jgi:RNA polymerase sigma-70 factor (ECF subfamily)
MGAPEQSNRQPQRAAQPAVAAGAIGAACPMLTLIRAVAEGDQGALCRFYEQTAARLFAIARAILGSKEDAEEVVFDVYLYAWQHSTDYDESRGSVGAWLAVLAKSRAIDRLRQRRNNLSLDDAAHAPLVTALVDEGPHAEQLVSQGQMGTAIHRALRSLTPKRQQLIDLAFFQGLTHQELAEVSGMRLGTVKSHMRRALADLKSELSPDS